ncbi:MAG TPA: protein-S-isoprenylcysteine O-methyltransferase [Beijerinckiaceae bacterium]|jgi:protein-S-isoprenylcysteine O-methyltransferase Ste14|nr:methyltransferase [Microvirga sp.]HZB38969.1 protein-S-isoprenylcysteine O-methyltransferase [Beijerinckiaceae bacterium]
MDLFGKMVWVAGIVAWYLIRYPFERKAKRVRVVAGARSTAERIGLAAGTLGLGVAPAIYVATGFPRAADYAARPWAVVLGTIVYAAALWLFHRSHKDLGRNWSITLEIRDQHRLVSNGIYGLIRHPMYSSFWLMALGQALLLPNWVAGLAGLVGFGVLYFLRVGHEERMMLETFGDEYRAYMARTKRIIPHLH